MTPRIIALVVVSLLIMLLFEVGHAANKKDLTESRRKPSDKNVAGGGGIRNEANKHSRQVVDKNKKKKKKKKMKRKKSNKTNLKRKKSSEKVSNLKRNNDEVLKLFEEVMPPADRHTVRALSAQLPFKSQDREVNTSE